VGAPLLEADGTLFGTVCALDQQPVPLAMAEVFEEVRILARMLSTIRAGEEVAADRSAAAASAYALATRDGLTGLLNRRGWSAALDVEEHRARRYGRAVSVVVLDVDGLKQFNDHAGHLAGDQVLVACARAIGAACRPGDAPARLGGDEFAVLAVECDVVCARALSARLRRELLRAGVLASVGFATRRIGEDLTATLHRADQAMYRMKRQQRARRQPIPESSGVGLGSRVADRAP
jgi:diguanylate cyclase (GGDEF)-like protein